MKKLLLLTIITTFLLLSLVTAVDNCHNASADPIPLCTCDDLNKTTLDLSADYQIQNNIDCSGFTFTQIGAPSSAYTGDFFGQGYNITDLTISQAGTNYIGLFRSIAGQVYNTNLVNADITGADSVGGLAGYLGNSNITNCSADGTFTGTTKVGGLAGNQGSYSLVNNSRTSGTVTSSGDYAGGIIGYASPSSGKSAVNTCSSSAAVLGASSIGGLIGYFGSNTAGWTILNCFATGNVNGSGGNTGGLVGNNYRQSINNSYATGNVYNSNTASASNLGGFIGGADTLTISNSYATGDTIGVLSTSGIYSVGGFGGSISSSKIVNSYSTGNAQGNYRVGGFVGTGGTNFTNCFSTGNVSSASSSTAGFISRGTGNIYNSYSTGTVSSVSSSWKYSFVGDAQYALSCKNSFWNNDSTTLSTYCGATGKSTADLQNAATFTDVATAGLTGPWDFIENPNNDSATADIWTFSSILNGAFPILRLVGYGLEMGSPVTTLTSPADNHAEANPPVDITFNCSAVDSSGLSNMSLYLTDNTNNNLDLNQTTNITSTTNTTSWTINLDEGIYSWNCRSADNNSNTDWGTQRTLNIDPTAPVTTLNSPTTNFYNDTWDPAIVTFNCSATDNVGLSSIDLYLTDKTNSSFIENQTSSVSGTSASTTWTLNLSKGNYTWNCLSTDVASNTNFSSNQSIRINFTDTTAPTFTGINNLSYIQGNDVELNINATDNFALGTYIVNDTTNFAINSSGLLKNNTNLSVGLYNLQITANDSYNNNISSLMWVNITPIPTLTLTMVTPTGNINATQNQTFTVSVIVTCNNADCNEVNISLDPKQEEQDLDLDDVATIQSAISLYDNKSFLYDIQDGCDLSDAQADVFDGGIKLYIDNSEYTGTRSTTEDDGREAYCGDQTKSSLNINRKVYVPSDQNWARYLDILENPTGAEICVDAKIYQNMGSDGSDYLNTSDGDTTWEVTDYWMMWDDTSPTSSDDAAGFIYQHENGDEQIDSLSPTTASGGTNQWIWEEVCVGAGDTAILMHFFTQWDTRLQSETEANIIYENYLDDIYSEGMSTDEISQVVNWPMVSTKSGLISNVVGDTPFYTETINPFNTTLTAGQSKTITWEVNATGQTNVNHTFFIFANITSDMSISDITTKWNVTILNETQETSIIQFERINNTYTGNTNQDINYTITDSNYTSCWYTYDSETQNYTLSSCENITDVTWTEGEHTVTLWTTNSTNEEKGSLTFIIDLTAPTFTGINNVSYSVGNSVSFNINATDESVFDSYAINDTTNFAINSSGFLKNNTDLSIGMYNLQITANDSANNLKTALMWVNITPTATITLDMVTPLANINATQNQTFTVSVDVTCNNANCGEVNVSLDPEVGSGTTSPYSTGSAANSCKETGSGTVDSCFDGSTCTYPFKIEQIYIEDMNNTVFTGGDTINVTLTTNVGCCSPDAAWAYANASNYTNFRNTGRQVDIVSGTRNYSKTFVLDDIEGNHTIRGMNVYSSISTSITCGDDESSGTSYSDTDDVIIYVQSSTSKSGLISNVVGDTPFYTETTNPYNITLTAGQTERISWEVNATGQTNVNHTFFIFANITSDLTIGNITNKWNVTIINETQGDRTTPAITFATNNNTYTTDTNLDINYSIIETNLSSCWYTYDSETTNYTLPTCGNITDLTWTEGQHTLIVWANDSENEGRNTITFTIDLTDPTITFITEDESTSDDLNLDITYRASDTNLDSCWYSNDSMSKNTTLTNCTNITDITWTATSHTITVWTNDSANNQNSDTITFTIEDTAPRISFLTETPIDNTFTSNQNIITNTSIIDQNIANINYNWNGTNYTIYNNSLVLMYNFDNISVLGENDTHILDITGNGYNGTTISAPYANTSGKYGGAYEFDGIDDYINTTYYDETKTISFWFKTKDFDTMKGIVGQRHDSAEESGNWQMHWSDNSPHTKLRIYTYDSGVSGGDMETSTTFDTGVWYHFAFTSEASDTRFYVNGEYDSQHTWMDTILGGGNNNDNLVIGGSFGNTVLYPFNGSLDELKVWNRTLDAEEIYQQYASNLNKHNTTQWYLYVNQSKNSTDILDDASYTYQIFTSDTANNKNSTEKRTIKIDSTKPIIQITTPNNNTFSSNANLNINYTITESNIDTCWYSNDSMSINTTLASCANITTVTWSDGQHNVTIWTNDSANNQNSSTISFNIDSNTPLISITTPNNNTFSSNANLNINYTITESNIDTCWYSNDSMSINTTLASCANITTVTWSDGQHNVTIWVNDSSNRINQTSVTFSIDTTTPLISITTPTNNTLSNNQNININYTITEANIDSCWYSNDSMSTNTTLASCANITTITWSEGQHNVTIWVNDSSNRINKSSISFTLDLSPPTYQHNNTNQTITGLPTLFSLSYADTTGLSGYIFSTNNTGQWVNDSWSAFGTGFTNMEDWTYRKSHIVEKTDNAGTNYTTKIHIINGTGTDTGDTVYINSFENNKLKTDFGDVRFTNEDSQLLNYWIENLTTTNATFWINIDGNLSASNQTIYIYYGNSSKTNVSNGTATFVFFDDFNDGIIDSNKWNSSSGITTSISESGGSGKIIGSTSGTWNVGYFKTYDTFSPGHSIIAKQYFNQVSGNIDAYSGFIDRDVVLYAGGGQTNYINLRMYRYSWVGGGAAYHDLLTSNAGVGFNQNTNNPRDAWKIIEYNWDNNYAQILFNGINQSSNSNISSIPTVSLPAGFLIDSGSGANGYTYTDWFAIRKYVETEPSHSTWGEEETASASGAINVTKTLNDTLALTISWCIYANDTANNWNHSCNPPFTVRTTSNDTVFPTFTNFITNNNTLIGTGTAIFNTTINNTNGTTWITLNNINYTATVNTNNYSTSINLTNGTHSYKWYSYGNGIHNKLNSSRTLFYTVKPDQDQDGLDDTNDTLEYNETYVIKEGITELNITVGGNSTNQTFTEKQQVIFYEETSPIINFSHNFTQSELDLSKVTIIKEETSLIVNFSGQLQENKTLFITDNEFISLCVKDEEISSVSEISSSCAGSNETDFTNCLDGQARINGINCTDLGDTIKIENLKHSGIKGTQETILSSIISGGSSGGSGTSGGITPSATTNKTKFEKKECYTNEDCPTHYHCYESQCAKLFDIKIIDATVIDGHLHFTYYIKGMAKFNNDITIKFWLEKDNTNYTEGQDIIYLGEYEEKTETTKLYLPSELEKGTYKFYIETSFEDYSATSYRTLELEKDGQEFTAALSPEEEKTRTSDFMNLIIVALLTMLIITITKITNPKDWIKEKIKLFTTKQPMKVNILEKPTEQKVEKSTKEKQKVIKLIKTKVKKITKPKVAKPVKAKTKVTKKAKHKVAKPIKAKVKKPIKAKHKPIKAKVKKPIKTKHKPVKAKTKVTKQPNLTKALLKEILKPKEEKEDKLTKGLLREILKKR